MNILTDFFNYFNFQLICLELIFCWKTPHRSHFMQKLIPAVTVFIALPYLIPGGYFAPVFCIGWFSSSFFVMMLISAAVLNLCFQMSWKKLIFYCCIGHTAQHLIHALERTLTLMFHLSAAEEAIVQNVCFLGMILASVFFFRDKLYSDDSIDIENKHLLIFAGFSTVLVYFFSMWTRAVEHEVIGSTLFDMMCCALMLTLLLDLLQISKMQQQYLIVKQLLVQEQLQNAMSKANVEAINRKCHDMKHQIALLRRSDNQQARDRYLSELEDAILLYDRYPKTGNQDFDLTLAEKYLYCEQFHIDIRSMVDGEAMSFMASEDIYSFFGNAIDNAIEAVRQIEDPDARIISIYAVQRGNIISAHIENPCADQPIFQDGLPITTKADKNNHGFGVQSMKFIAEKYHGTLSTQWEDGIFFADAIFCCNG